MLSGAFQPEFRRRVLQEFIVLGRHCQEDLRLHLLAVNRDRDHQAQASHQK